METASLFTRQWASDIVTMKRTLALTASLICVIVFYQLCFTEAVKKTKEVNLHRIYGFHCVELSLNFDLIIHLDKTCDFHYLWLNKKSVMPRGSSKIRLVLSLHQDKHGKGGRYDLNSRNSIVCLPVKSEDHIPSTSNGSGSFRYNSCTFVWNW
jgi:hypothetical protein